MKTRLLALLLCVTLLSGCGASGTGTPEEDGYDGLVFSTVDRGGETWDQSVLCIGRYYEGEKIIGLFNFSEQDRTAWINETDGLYEDMLTGKKREARGVDIPAYSFYYLKKV